MKETILLKIALICSLLGLVILFFISAKIDVGDYKPHQLNDNVGEDVKLTGTIARISHHDGVAFIELRHQSPVTIVLFTNQNISLKVNDSIEVLGEVQDYKGKNEIIAQKIRVIR